MKQADYETLITTFQTRLNSYNQHSAALDTEQNEVNAEEKLLGDWNKRYLASTGAQYGTDSSEYEAVGGTRQSERKKPKRGGSSGTPTS